MFSNYEDRGFQFSDSVYEVIPFYNSKIIAFDKHILRLRNSCKALSIAINIDATSEEIMHLIRQCGFKDGYVYYQASRGVDDIRSHIYKDSISIETFGYVVEHAFPSKSLKEHIVINFFFKTSSPVMNLCLTIIH